MFLKRKSLSDDDNDGDKNDKLSSLEDLRERESKFEDALDDYGDGDDQLILPGEDNDDDEEIV